MLLKRGAEALTPIYRNRLFHSNERVATHSEVANELADHTIDWKRGAVDAAMYKGQVQRLEAYVLRYGAEVEIAPRPFDGFALVHMSLRGATEAISDSHHIDIAEGRAGILAPRERIRLRWHAGTEQLILKVPDTLIDEARAACGQTASPLPPAGLVPMSLVPQWDMQMRTLLNLMQLTPDAPLDSQWLAQFERNVAMFALSHHEPGVLRLKHAAAGECTVPWERHRGVGGEGLRVEAALRYMQKNLAAPMSLHDIAMAAGVSVRTLTALCHRHLGAAPMAILRAMRLDTVHRRLSVNPRLSVTRAATEAGFGNLGRFAAYYAARFGHLPRETASHCRLAP